MNDPTAYAWALANCKILQCKWFERAMAWHGMAHCARSLARSWCKRLIKSTTDGKEREETQDLAETPWPRHCGQNAFKVLAKLSSNNNKGNSKKRLSTSNFANTVFGFFALDLGMRFDHQPCCAQWDKSCVNCAKYRDLLGQLINVSFSYLISLTLSFFSFSNHAYFPCCCPTVPTLAIKSTTDLSFTFISISRAAPAPASARVELY